jgi:hypothetical protein
MASSVFWETLIYTKQRLEAIPAIPTVKIRKKPVLLQEDVIPIILVTPGKEKVGIEAFEQVVEYIYEIQITMIRPGNRIYEADVESFLKLRQSIRNTLYQPTLPGANTVIDAIIETTAPFDVVSGDAGNYDISGLIIRYKSIEERVS